MKLLLQTVAFGSLLLALGAGCSATPDEETAGAVDDITSGGCTDHGLYCGGNKVSGDKSTLFECRKNARPRKIATCESGCEVRSGSNDGCKLAGPPLEQATTLVKTFYRQDGPSTADYESALSRDLRDVLPKMHELPNGAGVIGIGADFTCAQEFPFSIEVDPAVAGPDPGTAVVVVHEKFDSDNPVRVTVRLSDMKITGWRCKGPAAKHTVAEAHAFVAKLWGDDGPDGTVAEILPSVEDGMSFFLQHNETHADGMTCAQDSPLSVKVGPASEAGGFAAMLVHQKFQKDHPVTVSVNLDTLKISSVGCPD